MRARTLRTLATATAAPLLALGCNGLLGIGAPAPAEAPAAGPSALDSSIGTGAEAAADAPPSSDEGPDTLPLDAGPDGALDSASAVDPYHDVADPTLWESVDLSTDAAVAPGFAGGAFDGRYLYVPSTSLGSAVARYDTRSARFSETWDVIALPVVSNVTLNPWGAVYDGVSVTFVPGSTNTIPSTYAPSDPFASASIRADLDSGWISSGNRTYGTYCGGVALPSVSAAPGAVILAPLWLDDVDGIYPNSTVALFDGQALRFHTIHGATVATEPSDFCGAVFDGRYVYFAPSTGALEHLRFDTQYHPALADSFADPGAWLTVHVTTVGTQGSGFFGGVFDGRYVYYVPYFGTVVARFDTTKPFDDPSSWLTFDLTPLATPPPTGFQGGAFDGRYLYLIPTTSTPGSSYPKTTSYPPDAGIPPLVRYETSSDHFSAPSAWQAFDLHRVNPGVAGFTGGIFDGEYLYLVPANNALFLRFHARSPGGMGPPGYSRGSFF